MVINQAQIIFDELKKKIDISQEEQKAYFNSLAEQLGMDQSDIYPGLLPWEPLITGHRDYMTSQYIADEGTECEQCGKAFAAGDPIVHGCGVDCCSWECAIEYGKNHLYVHHIGAY